MLMNGGFTIGREALVSFTGPLMVLDYFSLLSVCCQLMQSLIFTEEQSCLCSSRSGLHLPKAYMLAFVEVMLAMAGGVSSLQGGGAFTWAFSTLNCPRSHRNQVLI